MHALKQKYFRNPHASMRHGFGTFRDPHASMRDDFGTFRDPHASMRDDLGTFRDPHASMHDNFGTSESTMHACMTISDHLLLLFQISWVVFVTPLPLMPKRSGWYIICFAVFLLFFNGRQERKVV